MGEKIYCYCRLARLNQPIGIMLLLWPTLWGLWLSTIRGPTPSVLIIFILGVILMRSAGCIMNDLADKKFDGYVERTRTRPLVTGEITHLEAVSLAIGMVTLAAMLVINLNLLTIKLSGLALLLAATYPFTKRFLVLPQAYLGVAFGFGIPMAYAANTGNVPLEAILVLVANVFWAIAYDTEYAMVDRKDDELLGIKTSALLFRSKDVLCVFIFQFLFLFCISFVGWLKDFGELFYVILLLAFVLVIFQYPLIKYRNPKDCLRAFKKNNWVGATVFLAILLEIYMNQS